MTQIHSDARKPKRGIKLGQEVFVLNADGDVERTMVAKIYTGGRYTFLNGKGSHNSHWLHYAEAVAVAQEKVSVSEAVLRRKLTQLRRRRAYLDSESYMETTMKSPYEVVELRDIDVRRRTRKLKGITVPKKYPKPGSLVYVVIELQTKPEEFMYRPFECFVLETKVLSVGFTPDGKLHYIFSTRFDVSQYYRSRDEAVASCPKVSGFVSHEEENAELKKLDAKHIPF